MPESERPEKTVAEPSSPGSGQDAVGAGEDAGAVIERLASAVERLLGEVEAIRERAAAAEASHARLSEALGQSDRGGAGAGSAEEVERRLAELAEENRRLRSVIEEARERVRKLRGRLMVVEDEL